MTYDERAERDHLISEALEVYPNASISIDYDDEDEAIHLTIDGMRFTFNVGSDDDAYVFQSGDHRIVIPALDR